MSSVPKALAKQPGDCCFTTVKHSGNAVGHLAPLGGINTYFSSPPEGSVSNGKTNVIIFFTDVFGAEYINNQLLADYWASQGFEVAIPDYMFGDPIDRHLEEEGFDRQAWISKTRAAAEASLPGWLVAVKEKFGTTDAQYFAIGHCFGGPFALRLATTDDVTAVAIAHPSALDEDHFVKLTKPILLACAETDRTFNAESRRRAVDILIEHKHQYQVTIYSGVSHGFAARGDVNIEHIRWAKEDAARSFAAWFTRWANIASESKL